jgi:LysM repeat protein
MKASMIRSEYNYLCRKYLNIGFILKKYFISLHSFPHGLNPCFALAFFFLFSAFLPACAIAKEDTALLSFQKVLPAEQIGKPYIIREGDSLYSIIYKRLGIRSPKARQEALDLIKKLNPNLTDPRKLRPGQALILPENQFSSAKDAFGVETVFYKVKKGDSLEKILMNQLNVRRSNMTEMLHNIKELNPRISNLDHIVVNQTLRLPSTGAPEETGDSALTEGGNDPIIDPDKPIIISETLKRNLLLAGDILNRIHGTLVTDGQYYLPLENYGQITIDCSSIPVVEFGDGSIVFVELKSRLPERVKALVKEHWSNYRFTAVHEKDTLISILQKVVNQSRSHRMKKDGRVLLGEKLAVQITPEWSIQQTQNITDANLPAIRHGLLFYKNASQSLPSYLTKHLSDRGVVLTEVVLDSGIIRDKQDGLIPLAVPNISGSSKIDLIHNLLVLLGQDAAKDVELNLFDKEKGGFNLTMRADIILKRDNVQTIVSFGRIPQEFADMLKKSGNEILTLNGEDSKIKLITKILGYFNISYTFNYFRLTVNHADNPEAPFISAIFPALQLYQADKYLYYLVDFPFDSVFYSYFKRLKEVNIIQY